MQGHSFTILDIEVDNKLWFKNKETNRNIQDWSLISGVWREQCWISVTGSNVSPSKGTRVK